MIAPRHILMTGGSGRLGTELRGLLEGVAAPDEDEMDILRPDDLETMVNRFSPEVLLHCAAYTDVAGAETDRRRCWQVNVDGTRNVMDAARRGGRLLVHISTDYVFEGTTGGYREDDPPGPPANYYALTKLVAEAVARCAPRHLVLRTSFRPRTWPYPVAFTDVRTSQDYVDVIAPMLAAAIRHADEIDYDTLHVATEPKSAFELARRRKPDVAPGTKDRAGVSLPDDISLDIRRWQALRRQWSEA